MTKGQSDKPCPSVYSPAAALRSLSSVALSSEQARGLYHEFKSIQLIIFRREDGTDAYLAEMVLRNLES
jgi:hypothetical protein